MKIWVVGRNYPLRENQLKGSFELEQAKMLAKKDELEVCYLAMSLHPTKRIKKLGFQKWIEDGVSVFSYSIFFLPRIYPFYLIKLRDMVWEDFFEKVIYETGMPDVIHIHYPIMLMLANVLEEYKSRGVKIVVTEHWTKVLEKKLDSCELAQQKKYVNFVDSYICVGKPLQNSIRELTNTKREIFIIPNVVSSEFSAISHDSSVFNFIAVGRLIKLKQFDKIIEVFAELYKNNSGVKLSIIGGGEEFNYLTGLINKLGVSDNVELLGILNRQDTSKIVQKADCLICYSEYETFGVPVIEAWACGIPTIISNQALAIIDYYETKLGEIVDPKDSESLKRAMVKIQEFYEEYDHCYISNYAMDNFSEKTITDRLLELYNQ